MQKRQFYYRFRYVNTGKEVLSGGNEGVCIVENVDHNETKVGDIVNIWQFNISGSMQGKAEIIGKVSYDWDMSKPIGQRRLNYKAEGVGYLPRTKLVVAETNNKENVLGYILPTEPKIIMVLSTSAINGATVSEFGTVDINNTTYRLANKADFDKFRVVFDGYDNEAEYEFAK